MIPAAFDYHAPTTIGEATALLARLGEDAKVLSGGQSLIPLMKLRLASPAHVVDINGIPGLSGIREADGALRIGALTRESDLEESEPIRSCAISRPSAATWPTAIRRTTTRRRCSRSAPRSSRSARRANGGSRSDRSSPDRSRPA